MFLDKDITSQDVSLD